MQKISSPTETRTLAKGFKVLCANHYTIRLVLTTHASRLLLNPTLPTNLLPHLQLTVLSKEVLAFAAGFNQQALKGPTPF